MKRRKGSNVATDAKELPRVERPKTPTVVLVRMFLIGSVAVIASIWAIYHHYTTPRVPMLEWKGRAAATSTSTTPSASATEIEIEVPPP